MLFLSLISCELVAIKAMIPCETSPEVPLRTLSVAANQACGLSLADGTLVCWSLEGDELLFEVPTASYEAIGMADQFGCTLDTDGGIACFGINPLSVPADLPAVSAFSVGSFHVCGLDEGQPTCFERSIYTGASIPPDGLVDQVHIDVGNSAACVVSASGSATCWGPTGMAHPVDNPPAAALTGLSIGGEVACGLTTDSELSCWGTAGDPVLTDAPTGSFVQVSVGPTSACGLDSSGTLSCWGSHTVDDLGGPWSAVDVGNTGVGLCALNLDGYPSCWQGN